MMLAPTVRIHGVSFDKGGVFYNNKCYFLKCFYFKNTLKKIFLILLLQNNLETQKKKKKKSFFFKNAG